MTLTLPPAIVVMVTPSDPDIRSSLPLDCLQIKLPIMSLEQLRLNPDPTIAVILDGVMVTSGMGPGNGVGVGVGVRVVVDTTVSITVSEAITSATVDVTTTSSITEVAVFVVSVLEGMMEVSIIGGVVETSGGAAVEETEAGVDTATGVVDTAAHIIVKILLSNYLLQISKHTILDKASVKHFLKRYAQRSGL